MHLTWKDVPALKKARSGLAVKSKDKKIDIFFCSRITAMLATLNLYLDEKFPCTWRKASIIAAKAVGRGEMHACNLCHWLHLFLSCGELPTHKYGKFRSSMLSDEDFAHHLKIYLMEKSHAPAGSDASPYISGQTVVGFVALPET